MHRHLPVSAIVIGILLISGCKKMEQEVPKTETTQQTPNTQPMPGTQQSQAPIVETKPSEVTQTDRDTYMKSAREEIDKLKGEIDALAVKAKTSSAELKAKMETKIKGLQDDLQIVENKFGDIKNASATAWQETKNSMNESIEKLRKAIKKEDS